MLCIRSARLERHRWRRSLAYCSYSRSGLCMPTGMRNPVVSTEKRAMVASLQPIAGAAQRARCERDQPRRTQEPVVRMPKTV